MVTFREFKVGELFEVVGNKQVKSQKNIVERADGIPFVVQSTKNNMVKCHVDRERLLAGGETVYEGNAIVLGVVSPVASYQESEFGASQSISLRADFLNPTRGLYLVTVIRKVIESKYSYTNLPGIQKYKEDLIQLPVKEGTDPSNYTEDDIDWSYMESTIRELEESTIRELDAYLKETGLDDYTLTDDEREVLEREPVFKEFEVGELFDCSTTKSYNPNKGDLPNGNTPYVTRSAFNNGISGYFDDESGVFMNDGNCITIGAEGGVAFYQPDDFIAGIKVYTLRHDRMNCEIGMFLCGALNVHSHIYSYTNARVLDKIKAETVQLPVKPGTDAVTYTQDDIDWTYMEAYVRIMEKQVIADVVDYKNEVISKTKELVKN